MTNQDETIGIFVCTHSILAEGLKSAVEMIMGPQQYFETVGLFDGDDLINLSEEITKRIKAMGMRKNIIFTDLFGATPSNASAMSLVDIDAIVITGVNLPMIIAFVQHRSNLSLKELDEKAQKAGKLGISVAGKLLESE